MPYTGSPSTNAVDALRLLLGDTYSDMDVLQNADYQYFLDTYGSVNRAAHPAAMALLLRLSRWTRERTGDIEVYGSDWAKTYRVALVEWTKNPNLSLQIAVPYAGGISKADMKANDLNTDNARPSAYEGMTAGLRSYESSGERPLDEF